MVGNGRGMHPLLFRLLEANRTLGLSRMLWVGPRWLIHREFLVLVRDLRRPLPESPRYESIRWTTLTEAEIHQVRVIDPRMSETEIRRRWEEGQECLLCWSGESLAHYRWDTTRPAYLPYLGKTFRPLDGDIYAASIFTHPTLRGRGFHEISSIMALQRARDRGFARSVTVVAWWNAPSLRVNREKTGRIIAGTVGFWNAGLWRHYFASGEVFLDDATSFYIRP